MALNPQYDAFGQAFAQSYYNIFDDQSQRKNMIEFYNAESSMITLNGTQKFQGAKEIMDTILAFSFRFQVIQHLITKVDCQPMFDGGILINVLGQLKTDDDPPQPFSQTFVLKPIGDTFYLQHDIFRLGIPNCAISSRSDQDLTTLLNPRYDAIGQAFAKSYYAIFDDQSQRGNLINFYDAETSLMTFEGIQLQGAQNIMEKFNSLTFQSIQHIICAVDCQPLFDGGIAINVLGQLKTDDDPPHSFSQAFILKPIGDTFFLQHDIFRLGIHSA